MLEWQDEPPPVGQWAYSVKEGLFRIQSVTKTHYLETLRVYRMDHGRLETGIIYTVFVEGPFLYPLPGPKGNTP